MRAIYRQRDSWVLCRCACGRDNYVEPHGTTAQCRCSKEPTEHTPIPYNERIETIQSPYRASRARTR